MKPKTQPQRRKLRFSIVTKIQVLVISIIVLSISSILFASVWFVKNKIEVNSIEILTTHSEKLREKIADWLNTKAKMLPTLNKSLNHFYDDIHELRFEDLEVSEENDNIICIFTIFSNGDFKSSDRWVPDEGNDLRTRHYHIKAIEKNDIIYSDVYLDSDTKEFIVTIAKPLEDKEKQVKGSICLDLRLSTVSKFIDNYNLFEGNGKAIVLDSKGMIIVHKDRDVRGINIKDTDLAEIYKKSLNDETYFSFHYAGQEYLIVSRIISGLDWRLLMLVPKSYIFKDLKKLSISIIILGLILAVVFTILTIVIVSRISKGLKSTTLLSESISKFDLSNLDKLSVKNYRNDEMGDLLCAMSGMSGKLSSVLQNIKQAGDDILLKSKELQQSAQVISDGASEQAATLEQLSESMIELKNSTEVTMDNALKTETVAKNTSDLAQESASSVEDTLISMNQVAEKIKIIQDIAAQTNLLALNASVEAARAGKRGKGFSVVAKEVSKLADLSAEASKSIQNFTQESVQVANSASNKLNVMLNEVKKTTGLVTNISSSSRVENNVVQEVNKSIQEFNKVVQHNAAQAEELSSAAENFLSYAEQLKSIVNQFKL